MLGLTRRRMAGADNLDEAWRDCFRLLAPERLGCAGAQCRDSGRASR